MTPQPDAPVQQQSWFTRNWKWVIPLGCLVPMLCCGSFITATYFGISSMIEHSVAFKDAMTLAGSNSEVENTLGTPLKAGMGVTGTIKENNGTGMADFRVPLSGPKGKGTLHVVAAALKPDQWVLSEAELNVEGGARIDLLQGDARAPDTDE